MKRTAGRYRRLSGGLLLCAVAPLLGAASSDALPESAVECLGCHEDSSSSKLLGDGTELSLYVDAERAIHSVHGTVVLCVDCHAGYDDDHPWDREPADRRAYSLEASEICQECHVDPTTRSLQGVHFAALERGERGAPVCTDCHGAHDVLDPSDEGFDLTDACGRCHVDAIDHYRASAHCDVANGSNDVPGCPSCHRSHDLESPHTDRYRLRSPQICLGCHTDAERMARYDLTTDVGPTYLADFHGVTAALSADADEDPRQLVVTCLDCHGYHEIASPGTIGAEAMRARVAATCASCHENASVDFPDAWLSHYRPSWRHARFVWLAALFYKLFIPFIVIGLIIQIVFHLYRFATRR